MCLCGQRPEIQGFNGVKYETFYIQIMFRYLIYTIIIIIQIEILNPTNLWISNYYITFKKNL